MPNFGVTESMVEGMVFGLDVPVTSTDNGPVSSIVTTLIEQHDAAVSARYYSEAGVDETSLDDLTQGYRFGQRWVLLLVLVDVVRGRTGNLDLAESYRNDLDAIEARWARSPRACIGRSAGTGSAAPYTHTDFVERATSFDNARDADWFRAAQDDRKL